MSLPRNSHKILTTSGCGELTRSIDNDCIMRSDIANCDSQKCLPPPPPRPIHRSCSVSSLAFLSNIPSRYCTIVEQNKHGNKDDLPPNGKKQLLKSKSLRIGNNKEKMTLSKNSNTKNIVENFFNFSKNNGKNIKNSKNSNISYSTPNLTEQKESVQDILDNEQKIRKQIQKPMASVIKNGLEIFEDENSNMKIIFSTNSEHECFFYLV